MAPEHWAALVIAVFLAVCVVCAVADWWSQAGRTLDRMVVDALDPIPPAPWTPDWDANEAAFDAMGVRR